MISTTDGSDQWRMHRVAGCATIGVEEVSLLLSPQSSPPSLEIGKESELALAGFERQVRDALSHLYDVAFLQTHPLTKLISYEHDASPAIAGKMLRQSLLDTIENLRPAPGTPANSQAYRGYRILEMRYIEGMDAIDIEAQLSISKSEYYREHERVLGAIVSLLHQRWHRAGPSSVADRSPDALALREAAELCARMRPVSVDLGEAIREVVDLLRPLCQQNGITLSVQIGAAHIPVHADRVVLRQVLLNSLRQAMDYAALGTLDLRVNANSAVATVDLTAPRPDAQSPLRSTLELTVSQHLIRCLRGELQEHPVAGGHAIHLVLPVRRCPRLLVIDNSADFVTLVSRYLDQVGWEVVGVSNPEEAYDRILEAEPRAILLDVLMPGRDGWELLRTLKATDQTSDIPVIVCSVLKDAQFAASLGAAGYLPKPVTQAALLCALSLCQSGRPEGAPAL